MSHAEWWNTAEVLRKELGDEKFIAKLTKELKPWSARMLAIEMIAWNDHNSEWNLQFDTIKKTRRFSDGTPITAWDVAFSVNNELS